MSTTYRTHAPLTPRDRARVRWLYFDRAQTIAAILRRTAFRFADVRDCLPEVYPVKVEVKR